MTKQRRLSWSALPLSFLLALPSPLLGGRQLRLRLRAPSSKNKSRQDYKIDMISKMNPANSENSVILSKSN